MIMTILIMLSVGHGAETSIIRTVGEITYMDSQKFCLTDGSFKTCIRVNSDTEKYLTEKGSITVITDIKNIIKKDF